ncbi:hypothetical protein Tco_1540046 [Tanacetum coccineum]
MWVRQCRRGISSGKESPSSFPLQPIPGDMSPGISIPSDKSPGNARICPWGKWDVSTKTSQSLNQVVDLEWYKEGEDVRLLYRGIGRKDEGVLMMYKEFVVQLGGPGLATEGLVMAPSDEAELINMVATTTTIDDRPRTRDAATSAQIFRMSIKTITEKILDVVIKD